jgi:diguanylate cyclase (GGDEF)-like protein
MSGEWIQAACLGQFLLSMSASSAALYGAATRRRRLYEPLNRLQSLLPEIRAGHSAIDDLSSVKGSLAPIARQFQEILHDLRAEKLKLAELDEEIRQRIANRTDALERKIGSLQQQATRDVLTGLLNRRALNDHLAKVVQRCTSTGLPASVLMIDVDNFKPLNDTLGHAAGDHLLRSIGQLLRSTLREKDTGFRCGGDEFVIVLEGSDITSANALATRLTSLVDRLVATLKVPALPRLSIGTASLADVSTPSAEALLAEADKRLYAIKGNRKRGALLPPPSPAKPPLRKSA